MKFTQLFMMLTWVMLMPLASPLEANFTFFPMVRDAKLGSETLKLKNPCSMTFNFTNKLQGSSHIKELIRHYQFKTLGCKSVNIVGQGQHSLSPKKDRYTITITMTSSELKSAFKKQDEKYVLTITKEGAGIKVDTYVGLVRAIETFYQALSCSQQLKTSCEFSRLPMSVSDDPDFQYRGLLIDTARHYLPVQLILQTIDAMMYNKMNVLHWHITDDDSFPLLLKSHPELAQHGAFSKEQVYTVEQVKQIVHYALVRGVRIIPEIPTPSHAASWSKKQGLRCPSIKGDVGGLNTQNSQTLSLMKDVFQEVFQLFPDPVIHVGGQPLSPRCINALQAFNVKERKNAKDGKDAKDSSQKASNLSSTNPNLRYREVQRGILKQLNSSKILMFWEDVKLEATEPSDIIQWTGNAFPTTTNKLVITRPRYHQLDWGVGQPNGWGSNPYLVWLHIYEYNLMKDMDAYENKQNILGAEIILWSQTSNEYTHHVKVWMRASSHAQRLWNSRIENIKPSVLRRMGRHQRIMDKRGIPTSPITCQQCELVAENC